MLTTTIRLDPLLMGKVELNAKRLGISKAAFIRDATLAYVTSIETREHVRPYVDDVLTDHSTRLDHIEHYIRRGGNR